MAATSLVAWLVSLLTARVRNKSLMFTFEGKGLKHRKLQFLKMLKHNLFLYV